MVSISIEEINTLAQAISDEARERMINEEADQLDDDFVDLMMLADPRSFGPDAE